MTAETRRAVMFATVAMAGGSLLTLLSLFFRAVSRLVA